MFLFLIFNHLNNLNTKTKKKNYLLNLIVFSVNSIFLSFVVVNYILHNLGHYKLPIIIVILVIDYD